MKQTFIIIIIIISGGSSSILETKACPEIKCHKVGIYNSQLADEVCMNCYTDRKKPYLKCLFLYLQSLPSKGKYCFCLLSLGQYIIYPVRLCS